MNRSTAESGSARILRGRVILRMSYVWYTENSEYTAIYDINDLWAVHLDRNGSLPTFKNEWDANASPLHRAQTSRAES